jgi:hypothetical protein
LASRQAVVVPTDDGSTHNAPTCTLLSVSSNVHVQWLVDTSTGVPFSVFVDTIRSTLVGPSSISNSSTAASLGFVAFLNKLVAATPLAKPVRPAIGGTVLLQPGPIGHYWGPF